MKKNTLLLTLTIIFGLPWIASAQFSGGSGTNASPYLISSTEDWNTLASNVKNGTSYSGNYFTLTADISVTTMVGTVKLRDTNESQCQEDKCFAGIFDGGGHTLTITITGTSNPDGGKAPFRAVSNATIKNLVVKGTVEAVAVSSGNTLSRHAGGLVGFVEETSGCTVENCLVSTNVGTGTDYAGGIIGHARHGSVTMTGCVYTGTLTVNSGGQVGGLIGWNDEEANKTITVTNCFFKGNTNGTVVNFHPIMCGGRAISDVTITNTYHTKDVAGTVTMNYTGSKHAYTVTGSSGVTLARSGNPTATYNTSKINAYSQGIVYDGTIYAGNGNNSIGLCLSYNLPGHITYSATKGSLSGSGHTGSNDDYTLNKNADGNTVISVSLLKTHIASTTSDYQMTWAEFATAVRGGTSYSGITVYLDENVNGGNNMAGTVGNNEVGKSFSGTFDGQGHTLTVSIATISTDTITQGVAPFRSIDGATIKNLVVSGSVKHVKTQPHASGLVGFAAGTNTIENCLVHVNVSNTSTTDGNRHIGGIIAHAKTANISLIGCVYDGSLNSPSPKGGLVAWSSGSTAPANSITLTNCFFNGSNHGDGYFYPIGCKDSGAPDVTVNNCYYTVDFSDTEGEGGVYEHANNNLVVNATNKGKLAYTITGASNVGVVRSDNTTTTYNVSKLDAYNPAIVYDGTIYAANGESIPLNLSCPGYYFTAYSATNGTLNSGTITGNNDAYTLSKATGNTIISVTNAEQKFHIANATSSTQMTLEQFAAAVNFGITYSGQTVYVDEDIASTTVNTVAGTSEKPFQGLFEGNGHTVNFTCSSNVADKGLIGYVSGTGAIQNVIVNASLSGTSTSVGTVVGTFASTGTISNVEGAGNINCAATNIGGLVGDLRSGTLHSSFAVATLDGSATNMGGLVGINGGNLYNSYSNASYGGSANNKGGLVGVNNSGKNVKNCYAAGIASGVSALAGSSSGIIQYCYADALGDGYVGTNTSAPTGCGLYGAVQSSNKHLDYMYRDNLITKNTNTYVGSNDAIEDGISVYVKKHVPVWNGLVSALNQWVRANPEGLNGLSPWYRPLTTSINGDLPVLGFDMGNSLATTDGKQLQYSASLDRLLYDHASHTAYVFLYGNATNITQTPGANVHVFVHEDAVLLQTTTNPGSFINTTVGITFDNSDHGQHAYDFWGNKLNYDWHLLSTPLRGLKTGAVHNSYAPSGNTYSPVDITDIGGYFPDGLITNDNPAVGGTIKWDFYTYYEPQYHWINLKRNKNNHYHMDGGSSIEYNEPDQDEGDNTAYYIPGKGYEMAISQDTYMNATGTLNKGNVSISLTNAEPDDILYAKGWNLVGNPYQGYLDLSQITNAYPELDKFYIYDADQGVFAPVVDGSSSNPVIPSKYIHPHQAFFVLAPSHNFNLTFQPTWAGTTTSADGHSYFRDNAEEPHYPLVNLFAEDETGHRDLTVIEFHRPELGGAGKLDYMRTSPFSLAAHYDGTSYGILFATDDIVRIPVRFKADGDGLITLRWSTHNGNFRKLILIDNKLGVEHDMLATDSYTFAASPADYSSRFYITYDCSGTGIGGDGQETESESFAYHSNGQIVIKTDTRDASLQVVDMMGRVLVNKDALNATTTLSANGLARGIYILRLSNRHQVKTQKIVVQ